MENLKDFNISFLALNEMKEIEGGGWEWWDDLVQGIEDGWNGGPEPQGVDLLPASNLA